MKIYKAQYADVSRVSEIFNLYRIFYKQKCDVGRCEEFIENNILENRSDIFILECDGRIVSFVQLYKNYCSIDLCLYYYLSDLYVVEDERGNGYATKIMEHIIELYSNSDFKRITLDTAKTNIFAQRLYEKLNYKRDETYITYHRSLN
ncbi:MAG: GNAT family N-acetyltransferase [Acinetobacter tjernbergiae]